jgi:hypothetical protein
MELILELEKEQGRSHKRRVGREGNEEGKTMARVTKKLSTTQLEIDHT